MGWPSNHGLHVLRLLPLETSSDTRFQGVLWRRPFPARAAPVKPTDIRPTVYQKGSAVVGRMTMSNKREKSLWKEIDKFAFLVSAAVPVILAVVYFVVAGARPSEGTIWSIARTLALDVIANVIPTFLLFAGSYLLLRHLQLLRSEQETEQLADRVALQVVEMLRKQPGGPSTAAGLLAESAPEQAEQKRLSRHIRGEFDITSKSFDDKSDPQRIVVRFTNRGSNVIHVRRIKYSDAGLGLPASALLTSYRMDGGGRHTIIPIDPAKSEVLPGQHFVAELCLAQKWDSDTIKGWAGKWGYLKTEVVYGDQEVELSYSI